MWRDTQLRGHHSSVLSGIFTYAGFTLPTMANDGNRKRTGQPAKNAVSGRGRTPAGAKKAAGKKAGGRGKPKKPRRSARPFGPELKLWQDGTSLVVGTDEAGRGPLAGPVVAAAVAFDPDVRIKGIGDSKVLPLEAREELDAVIREKALAWSVVERDHLRIDEINILQATREAMETAVTEVAEALGHEWPTVLVDGVIPRLAIGHHINVVGGDALSFSIGAASILAKVHRDRIMAEMDSLYPDYGFSRNKGYATAEHISVLRRIGPCSIHRLSFSLAGEPEEGPSGGVEGEQVEKLRILIRDLKPQRPQP